MHAWNGLCVFSLMLTIWFKGAFNELPNGRDTIYRLHIYIGFALTVGIILRLIWGFIGSEHAKFKKMWFMRDWVKVLKTKKLENSAQWGHDKYASLVYLFFYLMMAYQVISGLMFAARRFGIGPFSSFIMQTRERTTFYHYLQEIHSIIFYVSMVYVLLHIGMIIFHEKLNKHPIAQSMFSGFQFRNSKK